MCTSYLIVPAPGMATQPALKLGHYWQTVVYRFEFSRSARLFWLGCQRLLIESVSQFPR